MNERYDGEQDAGTHPHTPTADLPTADLPDDAGAHTGAPEDNPEHNTAPDGHPGSVEDAPI
ncbi:hypothetical protein ACU045_00305 [Microbacterium sp. MAHUQ-60]|uniref:hypothetical protein n=1 Tax=unclassified Microbacterium TaxID=2609290 RepID=UPI003605FF9A